MSGMKPGKDAGGLSVFQLPSGEIVTAAILVDEYGNLARISAGIPDPNGVVNVEIKDTSTREAFPAGAKKVFFYANTAFYYKFGDEDITVNTNGSQLPAGVGEFNIGNYTHIAVLRIASNDNERPPDNLNITKMD